MQLDSLSTKKQLQVNADSTLIRKNMGNAEQLALNDSVFMQKTSGVNSEESNWFKDWLNDNDKVCTDKKDDGKIGAKEALIHLGKGFFSLVKGVLKHPLITLGALAGGALLTFASGGALLPVMVAAGVTFGALQIGKGVYGAITADTDAEAKMAWENIGSGTFAVVTSALGAKKSLKVAGKAGVDSALGCDDLNRFESVVQCFKSAPEALKVTGKNVYYNARALFGTPKPQISPQEVFRRDKLEIENRLRIRLKKATNYKNFPFKEYYNEAMQQKVLNSINEDNIELAKALIKYEPHGMDSHYLVAREEFCKYHTRTMLKLLNAEPEKQQLALKILNSKNITHSQHNILALLTENDNAQIQKSFLDAKRATKYLTLSGEVIDGTDVPKSSVLKHRYLKENNLTEITATYDEATGKYVNENIVTELDKYYRLEHTQLRPYLVERPKCGVYSNKNVCDFYANANIDDPYRSFVRLISERSLDPYFMGELLWGENGISHNYENIVLLQSIIDKHQMDITLNAMHEEILSTFFCTN